MNMGLPTNQSQTATNFSVFQCIWDYLPTNHKLPKMSPSFSEYWTTNQPITICQKFLPLPMNMGLPTNQSQMVLPTNPSQTSKFLEMKIEQLPNYHKKQTHSPSCHEYGTTNQPITNCQKFLRLLMNMGLPTNQSQTAKKIQSSNEYGTNQLITNCQISWYQNRSRHRISWCVWIVQKKFIHMGPIQLKSKVGGITGTLKVCG